MSAPNKQYDPVEVASLSPGEVSRMRDEALAAVAAATALDELKAARLAHAGDRSPLRLANAEIGALPPEARAEAGKRIGATMREVNEALTTRQQVLEEERDQRVLIEEAVDVTLPWSHQPRGARHPVTTVSERLSDVFVSMGYEVAEGPEIEDEWYNFDALNFPPDHPAREMQDTLFVAGPDGTEHSGMVLRTHTSPVQIRAMLTRPLPLYVVSPGQCYRNEAQDATHSPVFHQIECLAVDEGLTMADLRGAVQAFVDAMFGEGLRTRLRPDYFPFTEPSADVSMECHVCRGAFDQAGRDALPGVPVPGLDRAGRLRHGQPEGAHRVRHRPGPLQRLRVRPRHRAGPDGPVRRDRHQGHPRGRRPVQPGIRGGGLMRVSLNWVLEVAGVDTGTDPAEVARRLTAAGLEVESVEQVGHDISGVVVAEVTEIEELTGFKKPVRYCQVDTSSGEPRGVVCGAVNFAVGDRVPLALPGARLPGGFEIGARKTYGHISEGMICSASELGIGDDHSGILVLSPDAPLGADFVRYAGLDDHVLDIAVTPDRGYALSVRGVSRELATSYGVRFTDPADADLPPDFAAGSDQVHAASIGDPTACDRFVLRQMRGFDPAAATPLQMRVRLARAGLRTVSLAVDVTNYLMLELGQPLHAFDADRLSGPIVVRRAEPGEKLETLDHVLRDLDPDDVVIADSSGPISMAGTMGGLLTEISETTSNLVIEAAHFDAKAIARESRLHKLFSEASYRFERGVNRELPLRVSAKAAALLAGLGGGTVVPGCTHAQVEVPQVSITMAVDYPDKVAGTVYGRDAVLRRLYDVGCGVAEPAGPGARHGQRDGSRPRLGRRRREPLPAS